MTNLDMPHSALSESREEDTDLPDAIPSNGVNGAAHEANQDAMDTTGDLPPQNRNGNVDLEGMFATDDEEDEFSSSLPANARASPKHEDDSAASSSPVPAPADNDQSSQYTDPNVMLAFYQRLFPFRLLFQWLNHAVKPSNDFAHREIAFTLSNDAYLRYQSYATVDLFRKDVLRLNPSRFEIGPVYTANPRDRKSLRNASAFRPLTKELVFDIDLTDYDEIRTCCTKANICQKCWRFIVMAIKVVDSALREDFGFKHIMWVYSGRRGAHAWISDKAARELSDDRRRAIAGYLEVLKGGAQSGKKVNVRRPLHPHLARSLDILKDHFQSEILIDQDPWRNPDRADHLLSLLPDMDLAKALRKKWESAPGRSSPNKWADIDTVAKSGASSALDPRALLEAKKDILLEYTYPRLDAEVSKKLIHLLKSPFVVHPKTGRVCVPIDVTHLDSFDPEAVPTVTDLLAEIDDWDSEAANNGSSQTNGSSVEDGDTPKRIQDYEKTGLKPYIEIFKTHVAALLRDERGTRELNDDGDPMEF